MPNHAPTLTLIHSSVPTFTLTHPATLTLTLILSSRVRSEWRIDG
jgi:hypothetical protein